LTIQLILFIASKDALDKLNLKTPASKEVLIKNLNALTKDLNRTKAELKKRRQIVSNMNELKSNLELYLNDHQVTKSVSK